MCSPGSDTKFAVFVLDGVQAITYLRMTHNVLYLRLTGLYNTQGFCLRSGYRCQKLGGRRENGHHVTSAISRFFPKALEQDFTADVTCLVITVFVLEFCATA